MVDFHVAEVEIVLAVNILPVNYDVNIPSWVVPDWLVESG
jgi:hypothetical protein